MHRLLHPLLHTTHRVCFTRHRSDGIRPLPGQVPLAPAVHSSLYLSDKPQCSAPTVLAPLTTSTISSAARPSTHHTPPRTTPQGRPLPHRRAGPRAPRHLLTAHTGVPGVHKVARQRPDDTRTLVQLPRPEGRRQVVPLRCQVRGRAGGGWGWLGVGVGWMVGVQGGSRWLAAGCSTCRVQHMLLNMQGVEHGVGLLAATAPQADGPDDRRVLPPGAASSCCQATMQQPRALQSVTGMCQHAQHMPACASACTVLPRAAPLTPALLSPPPPPAGGGRLSRLAVPRRCGWRAPTARPWTMWAWSSCWSMHWTETWWWPTTEGVEAGS
jgi:hypothetical protein